MRPFWIPDETQAFLRTLRSKVRMPHNPLMRKLQAIIFTTCWQIRDSAVTIYMARYCGVHDNCCVTGGRAGFYAHHRRQCDIFVDLVVTRGFRTTANNNLKIL